MTTNNKPFAALRSRLSSVPALALLAVLLLFGQASELAHSHDGDLNLHVDCDICLKLGGADDLLASDVVALDLNPTAQAPELAATKPALGRVLPATARAPPLS